jgi:hypothetical protein
MPIFEWWAIPLVLEGVVIIASILISALDRAQPSLAAIKFAVMGSLVCAMLALSCWTFAG